VKYLYFTFASLSVFMIVGMLISTRVPGVFGNIMYVMATVTVGFLLYLLLSTFLVDIIHLIVKISPKICGIIVLFFAVVITVFGVWNAFHIRVTEIEIPIKDLKKEIRIIHISDVHIGHVRGKDFMQNLVDITNSQNPDVVFITGDLFDGRSRLNQESISPLSQIKAPVYFVEGNHDGYAGVKTVKQYLRNLNVNVLENQVVNFGELQIVGLNHMRPDQETKDMHAFNNSSIKEVLDSLNIDETKPTVMLHHSPEGIKYASAHGIDLFLAGHTHAGQVFPINFVTNLLFSYNRGLHEFENTKIFVSQGVGTVGPPLRVGTKSEIILIKLVPEKY
jgi:predicted MPP superfamily phosphohydrolase